MVSRVLPHPTSSVICSESSSIDVSPSRSPTVDMAPINVLLSGLPTLSTLCLRIGDASQPLQQTALSDAVTAATGLPQPSFYLRRAGALLHPHSLVTHSGQHTVFVELFLRRALPGGKGGFGALLKGSSATKVTTNFDACRDLHGRRLRHVRDEAILAEYIRTHGPLKQKEDRPLKRPRPQTAEDDEVVIKVNTDELDQKIDQVNKDVEDSVAQGLRAAAAQRKRQRVQHTPASRAHVPVHTEAGGDSDSSSDSEGGEDMATVSKEGKVTSSSSN